MSALDDFNVRCSRSRADTQHVVRNDVTLCGRKATDWPVLDIAPEASVWSAYCCERCQQKAIAIIKSRNRRAAKATGAA